MNNTNNLTAESATKSAVYATVICKDCGKEFTITHGEKAFYEAHTFNLPKRCADCRAKRKSQ